MDDDLAAVGGVGQSVGQCRVDRPVDESREGRCGQVQSRDELTHRPAAAPAEGSEEPIRVERGAVLREDGRDAAGDPALRRREQLDQVVRHPEGRSCRGPAAGRHGGTILSACLAGPAPLDPWDALLAGPAPRRRPHRAGGAAVRRPGADRPLGARPGRPGRRRGERGRRGRAAGRSSWSPWTPAARRRRSPPRRSPCSGPAPSTARRLPHQRRAPRRWSGRWPGRGPYVFTPPHEGGAAGRGGPHRAVAPGPARRGAGLAGRAPARPALGAAGHRLRLAARGAPRRPACCAGARRAGGRRGPGALRARRPRPAARPRRCAAGPTPSCSAWSGATWSRSTASSPAPAWTGGSCGCPARWRRTGSTRSAGTRTGELYACMPSFAAGDGACRRRASWPCRSGTPRRSGPDAPVVCAYARGVYDGVRLAAALAAGRPPPGPPRRPAAAGPGRRARLPPS